MRNKIIMDMVIHDMRNPTTSMQMGLKKFKENLYQAKFLLNDHSEFNEKCQKLYL